MQDAEEYSEEDRLVKERTEAKNSLEGYLYNMRNVLDDEEGGIASKISEADKEVSTKTPCKWRLRWRDTDEQYLYILHTQVQGQEAQHSSRRCCSGIVVTSSDVNTQCQYAMSRSYVPTPYLNGVETSSFPYT